MLTDKEKLILHYVAFCSSRNIEDHHIRKMVLDVIHSRCRSIAPEDAHDIISVSYTHLTLPTSDLV